MLMGEYTYNRTSLEPLELSELTTGDEYYGLDPELGALLDDSEDYYRRMGLDGDYGLGGMGELHGFFSSVKKAFSKVTKKVQDRIKKDIKIIKKIKNKVTPKFLQKLEKKVLTSAVKASTKLKPKFLRKFEEKLQRKFNQVAHKVTPKFIQKLQQRLISTSPPGVAKARSVFMDWLQTDNPELHTVIAAKVGEMQKALPMAGLGANEPSIWDNIVNAAKEIIPAVITGKQQQDIYKLQLERANKGLPPLKTEEIAPVIKIQGGVSPEVLQTAGAGIQKMLLPIGIGAAALILLMKK